MKTLVVSLLVLAFVTSPSSLGQSTANPCAPGGGPRTAVRATMLPSSATATLTGYDDRAVWLAAVGGGTTVVNMNGFASGTTITTQLAPFGIASLSGTSPNASPPGPVSEVVTASTSLPFPMFTSGTLPSEPNFLSNLMTPAGGYATGDLTFYFVSPQLAVGAFVADGSPLDGFSIEVFSGAASLGSITVSARTLPNSFVGITSDVAFTSARFVAVSPFDSWGLDDVELGGTPSGLFCFGDGSGFACPCGNNSPVGADAGCLNSFGIGATLVSTGAPSTTLDSFVLRCSNMPNGTALYFQGTTQLSGGAGIAFGDGLRCAGGTIIRLGTKQNTAGASQYPAAGDILISIRGLVVPGDVRTYQVWYRNAASFCTASTFNLSNGLETTWI